MCQLILPIISIVLEAAALLTAYIRPPSFYKESHRQAMLMGPRSLVAALQLQLLRIYNKRKAEN